MVVSFLRLAKVSVKSELYGLLLKKRFLVRFLMSENTRSIFSVVGILMHACVFLYFIKRKILDKVYRLEKLLCFSCDYMVK